VELVCGVDYPRHCDAAAVWLRFKASRALGGVTGDVPGASCELGEGCRLGETERFFKQIGAGQATIP
jgi:hypothetical protein